MATEARPLKLLDGGKRGSPRATKRRAWHKARTAARRSVATSATDARDRARFVELLRRLPTDTDRRRYVNEILAVFGMTPL